VLMMKTMGRVVWAFRFLSSADRFYMIRMISLYRLL
jgi:hypothetical protein